MPRKPKHPAARIHRRWVRKPAQKPHSTKKGRKGYERQREQTDVREQIEY
jgi:hypothetical protein